MLNKTTFTLALILGFLILNASPALALQGSGRFSSGQINPRWCIVPQKAFFVLSDGMVLRPTTYERSGQTPGGPWSAKSSTTSYTNYLVFSWLTGKKIAGGIPLFNFSLPLTYQHTKVTQKFPGSRETTRTGTGAGLSDIVISPLMGFHPTSNIYLIGGVNLGFPVSSKAGTALDATGIDVWSFTPMFGMCYFDPQGKVGASMLAALDYYTQDATTNYHNGLMARTEGLLDFRPFTRFTMGAIVSWHEQVTADSGSATEDNFSRQVAVGGMLDFVAIKQPTPLMITLKYMHDFITKNRGKGETIWLRLAWMW